MISKDEFWVDLRKKDYDKILIAVTSNPKEFLNAIHPELNKSLFSIALSFPKENESYKKLINYIVSHDNFELNNSVKQTNIDSIVSLARLEVTKLLENDLRLVFNGKKLTYVCINERLKMMRFSEHLIPNLKEMQKIVRDLTIKKAIEEDNADLLKQLDEAGGNIIEISPKLFTEKSKNVKEFYENKIKEKEKKVFNENTKEMLHVLFKDIKKSNLINKDIENLNKENKVQQNKLLKDTMDERTKRIHLTVESLKKNSIFDKKNESNYSPESKEKRLNPF